MYFEGLKGSSVAKGYEGWIPVTSISFGSGQTARSGSGGFKPPVGPQPINLTAEVDVGSLALQQAAVTGKYFPHATLVLKGSLTIEMTGVMIASLYLSSGRGAATIFFSLISESQTQKFFSPTTSFP